MGIKVKVSVITIAWNDLAGLQRTIASVQEQDWADVEHIVVDGGSTDGTVAFLAETTGFHWISEKDQGRYDAMNKGVLAATGDLIWFMHSSDIFHSRHTISHVASHYLQHPFEWAYGLSRIANGSETIGIGGVVPFQQTKFVLGGVIIPHQAAVFRKDFFLQLGGYNVDFGLTADQLFMMLASVHSAPHTFAEVLCDFDASGAGSVRGISAHYRDTAHARRQLKLTVSGFRLTDTALSTLLLTLTRADRLTRKLLKHLVPRQMTGG